MSEASQDSLMDRCTQCPLRSRLSKVLAQIALGGDYLTFACDGPVVVKRFVAESKTFEGGPLPPKKEGWTAHSGPVNGQGHTSYRTVPDSVETACGDFPIEVAENEEEYDPGTLQPFDADDGKRYALFVRGDEQSLAGHRMHFINFDA